MGSSNGYTSRTAAGVGKPFMAIFDTKCIIVGGNKCDHSLMRRSKCDLSDCDRKYLAIIIYMCSGPLTNRSNSRMVRATHEYLCSRMAWAIREWSDQPRPLVNRRSSGVEIYTYYHLFPIPSSSFQTINW